MADPFYSSVVLQLSMDGANNGVVFTDGSPLALSATVVGGAVTSSASPKYGTASGRFYGGGDKISFSSGSLALGSGDFTIEFWANLSVSSAAQLGIFGSASVSPYLFVGKNGANNLFASSPNISLIQSASMTVGAWTHVALVRSGTTLTLWVNGASQGAGSENSNFATLTTFNVGAYDNSTDTFNGYIDDLRVTKGVARYLTAFTPPSELAPTESAANLVAPPAQLNASGGASVNSASMDLSAPPFALQSFGGGNSKSSPPLPTLQSFGGANAAIAPPSPRVTFISSDNTGANSLAASPPSPTLSAFVGINADLTAPSPTLSASMTATGWGASAPTAPIPTLTASGTVSALAGAALTAPMANLVGYGGAVLSVTGPSGTLIASGTSGSIGTAALVCPLFELTAGATAQNHGSASLVAPSPRMGATLQAYLVAPGAQLTAIGSAVVAATYEAYAMNLLQPQDQSPTNQYEAKVPAVTHYTNFPFTHVVRYKNSYFGANSTGLYLLEGTTDDGSPIPFEVKTHETDFGSTEHKTVESAYFAGRIGPAETVTLYAREDTVNAQAFTTPRGNKPQSHRQAFSRGLKARYFALGIAGSGEFELDTVDFSVGTTKRRI